MTALTFHPQRQGSVRFVILGGRLRAPVTDSSRGEVLQAQSVAFGWAVARREKSHLASELGAVPRRAARRTSRSRTRRPAQRWRRCSRSPTARSTRSSGRDWPRAQRAPTANRLLPARRESVAAASYLEQLDGDALSAYGGTSLHEQSYGQSFLAILLNRFGPNGLYLLDEPEAALSTHNCLTALRRIHKLVQDGSQFIISTHSPLILAYPDATIYNCTENGLEQVDYDDAEPVRLTSNFLNARERFIEALLDDS